MRRLSLRRRPFGEGNGPALGPLVCIGLARNSPRQRKKSMSDTAMRVGATTKPKTPQSAASLGTTFEIPKFEIPAAVRELAEKGSVQTKQNYEKMKATTEQMTGVVEATYATASKGA